MEHVAESEQHSIQQELRKMINEDHLAHIARYWNKSVAERERLLDGGAGMDLDTVDEAFVEIHRDFKHRYPRGWFKLYQQEIQIVRGCRSAQFAVCMSEVQRISTMLLCYQKSCKHRNVGILRELERKMAVSSRLDCIRASQVSANHVECLTDLLVSCGQVGLESMEHFDLSFSMLVPAGATRLGESLIHLNYLQNLTIQHCGGCVEGIIETMNDHQVKALTHLDLSHNKMVGASKLFGASLANIVQHLKHLDLSNNHLLNNTGHAISMGLMQPTCTLESIDVSWNCLEAEGGAAMLNAAAVCSAWSDSKTKRVLNLSLNHFRLEDVKKEWNNAVLKVPAGTIYINRKSTSGVDYTSLHPSMEKIQLQRRRGAKKKVVGKKNNSKKKKKKK